MIVVDSSVLIAILEGEADAAHYAHAISEYDAPLLSAAALVETGIVMLRRHGEKGLRKFKALVQEAGFEVQDVDARHAYLALEAYASFGKGPLKPAGLNYGDCFSYALAKATGLPLLYKGQDFSQTDIEAVH